MRVLGNLFTPLYPLSTPFLPQESDLYELLGAVNSSPFMPLPGGADSRPL